MSILGRVDKLLKVKGTDPLPGQSIAESFLNNKDLRPVEPERRTWSSWSFVFFWVADGLNLSTFYLASSAFSLGLSWYAAWIAVILGYTIVSFVIVITARIAAIYHISFPILARSSFGVWGAIWPTINRSAMACIWYGVQSYIGAQCVTLLLRSLAPKYIQMHNSLPASAGLTTADFVSFFLFSLISLPIIYIKPEKIRWFFMVKAVIVPIAAFAFFGWSIASANGLGPIVHTPATVSGSVFGWGFVSSVMSCISNMATLAVNIPDVARLAKSKRSVTWSQLLAIPFTFSITSFLGIIIASSSQVIYGELIWDPVQNLGERLNRNPYGSADRAGVFFISFAFIIGQIGTNVAANSLSAGHDLAAIMPRYITIRRGSFVAAAVGFAMCPWNLLKSSNSFTTYLSAYSLFLSSISGTMLCDYYIVRRGVLQVESLYTCKPDQPYRYLGGFNLRAFAAYISGIAMTVTGFAGILGANVSSTAQHMYTLAYPIGFLTSGLVYLILCTIFPIPGSYDVRKSGKTFNEPQSWESDSWFPEVDVSHHRQTLSGNITPSTEKDGSLTEKADIREEEYR
ncbi:NCS1 nucleoside transporter family [Meira miltonrushii]|uniref:NCS1 nucleoside transporter family n=1 Tax=Meira miltonrushii TaxID=1280837 RepID=A0A316V407_9BASI|nr:NCS1 nucleoside transporter family [Meira miltonrushii]PWN31738.1 NCS1 nucleoside transporter family [Meira miltonrushii]